MFRVLRDAILILLGGVSSVPCSGFSRALALSDVVVTAVSGAKDVHDREQSPNVPAFHRHFTL